MRWLVIEYQMRAGRAVGAQCIDKYRRNSHLLMALKLTQSLKTSSGFCGAKSGPYIPRYLKDTYQYSITTWVTAIAPDGEWILLDDTVFHPQGGGQPKDHGQLFKLSGQDEHLKRAGRMIMDAKFDACSGRIWHKLENTVSLMLGVGDQVKINISREQRRRNAIIHSGGHLIDLAVQKLEYGWLPSKGYHFSDNPYVEYQNLGCKFSTEELEEKVKEINDRLKNILGSSLNTHREFYSFEEAVNEGLLDSTAAEKVPKEGVVSFVKFGSSGCLCAGTHIDSLDQISEIVVSRAKDKSKKKKNTDRKGQGKVLRVYYEAR